MDESREKSTPPRAEDDPAVSPRPSSAFPDDEEAAPELSRVAPEELFEMPTRPPPSETPEPERWSADPLPELASSGPRSAALEPSPAAPVSPEWTAPGPPPAEARVGHSLGGWILLAVLIAVGVAGWRLYPNGFGRTSATPAVLEIESEPPGAEVRIDDQPVGVTPLVIENLYPAREIPIRVSARGFRSWRGTFRGGSPVHMEAKLVRESRGHHLARPSK